MVRIKHRYLLVDILYPSCYEPSRPRNKATATVRPVPAIVQLNQLTPDYVTPQLLIRSIRDQIELLFGEYGAGIAANGLKGRYKSDSGYNSTS